MTILELVQSDGFDIFRNGAKGYCSPCPACGGTDRFLIFGNRFWCRQCKVSGDNIEYLIQFHSMTFKEAADAVGKQISSSVVPARKKLSAEIPKVADMAKWRTEAEKLIDHAHRALMQNTEALSWLLAERGIRRETAERFRLGWIGENLFLDKALFGLRGDGKKLFIPSGLVIPWQNRRIRIRRDNPDKYGRYYVLQGSENDPMTIGDSHQTTGVIVESELDAILLSQEAARPLYVVALGSTSMKPCNDFVTALWCCPAVLVAFDNDEAGAKATQTWLDAVPGAFRTLTPGNKDLTDAHLAGWDLNIWLSASMELLSEETLSQGDKK